MNPAYLLLTTAWVAGADTPAPVAAPPVPAPAMAAPMAAPIPYHPPAGGCCGSPGIPAGHHVGGGCCHGGSHIFTGFTTAGYDGGVSGGGKKGLFVRMRGLLHHKKKADCCEPMPSPCDCGVPYGLSHGMSGGCCGGGAPLGAGHPGGYPPAVGGCALPPVPAPAPGAGPPPGAAPAPMPEAPKEMPKPADPKTASVVVPGLTPVAAPAVPVAAGKAPF